MFGVDVAFMLPASDPPPDSADGGAGHEGYDASGETLGPQLYQLHSFISSSWFGIVSLIHSSEQKKEKKKKCIRKLCVARH